MTGPIPENNVHPVIKAAKKWTKVAVDSLYGKHKECQSYFWSFLPFLKKFKIPYLKKSCILVLEASLAMIKKKAYFDSFLYIPIIPVN